MNSILAGLFLVFVSAPSWAFETVSSQVDFRKTTSALKKNLKESGFFVVRQVDHERNSKEVGENVPRAVVILFNKPLMTSVLLSKSVDAALVLPLRIAVVERDDGKVQLIYEKIEKVAEDAGIKLSSNAGAKELVERAEKDFDESIKKTIELPNKKKSK